MTNPLLRPDDRLKRPALTDAQGRNLFADQTPKEELNASQQDPSETNAPLLAAPAYDPVAQSGPSYRPQYETILPHRAPSLLRMSVIGFIFTLGLVLPFITIYAGYGLLFGFLGVMLCMVTALQAYQELTGMSNGAIDASGRDLMIIAYCLAMGGVLIGLAVMLWVGVFVYRGVMDLNL
jgi:hypothetical protein